MFIKKVIDDIVAHLKSQNPLFCQICNVLCHHDVLSRMLLAL